MMSQFCRCLLSGSCCMCGKEQGCLLSAAQSWQLERAPRASTPAASHRLPGSAHLNPQPTSSDGCCNEATTCKQQACRAAASRQGRQQRCRAGSSMQAEQAACMQGKQLTRSCSLRPRSVRPMARAGSPEGHTSICLRCATCHKAQGGRGLHAGCTFAMASGDQNAWCGCCTVSCTMQVMPQSLRQLPRR